MRVLITTPVLNAIDTIDATILSVIGQVGDFHLHYHLRDLGSTDGTAARLAWWQERLDRREVPLHCLALRFSWAADPGAGLGAALCSGFAALPGGDADFMTWIEPGDILLPGALALAASLRDRFRVAELGWFGGAGPQIRREAGPETGPEPEDADGNPPDPAVVAALVPGLRPMPTAVLAAGLCDGRHWDRLRQPGVFFRRTLWVGLAPQTLIASLGRTAPWAIWRALAQHTGFVHVPATLGRAHAAPHAQGPRYGMWPGPGSVSASEAAGEDALLEPEAGRAALRALAGGGELRYRLLRPAPGRPAQEPGADTDSNPDPVAFPVGEALQAGPRLAVVETSAQAALARHVARVLGPTVRLAVPPGAARPPRLIWGDHPKPAPPLPAISISLADGIAAFEGCWQFPAITEQHAARQMQRLGPLPAGITYVAFPWATLIDKLQTGAADAHAHLGAFRAFCRRLPPRSSRSLQSPDTGLRITVCQHILLRRYLWLLQDAGIDHVFWPHAMQADATRADGTATDGKTIGLHPFPLYPVQVPKALDLPPDSPRPWLFSFIGARANRYYLTQVRSWILDILGGDLRGLIEGRDNWHYNTVVYDHQVRRNTGGMAAAENASAPPSEAFLTALIQTVFALCPSGTGPNSIRLWEALGAGTIPVILADGWAPPGDLRLWEAAALFVPETPAAVAALPEQLAAIAADSARLAAMRAAGRQLWLLYGPDSFVTDISLLITRQVPQVPDPEPVTEPVPKPPAGLDGDAGDLLQAAARALLLGRRSAAAIAADPLLAEARAALAPDHPAPGLLDRVLAHHGATAGDKAAAQPAPAPPARAALLAAPLTATGTVPVVCLFGHHANRTPLAYAPFRRMLGDRLAFTADPGRADLVMTGYNVDLPEIARALGHLPPARRPRLAVVSEEPLWDSIWSGGFAARARSARIDGQDWAYIFLNHQTCRVFAFDHLPYFLLTRDDFAPRLALWILRHAGQTPAERLAAWQAAPVPAAFVAERREDPRYARAFPEHDVAGLSVYRSEVARLVDLPGTLRLGQGWVAVGEAATGATGQSAAPPRRQNLPDWHLDKVAQLDGRVRVMGAQENTHHPLYVSEKVFDAFAVGAVPLVHAGPGHRLHDLVGPGAMLNSFGLTAPEAAALVTGFVPGTEVAAAWLASARALAQRCADIAAIQAERTRVVNTLLAEIATLF